MKRTDEVGLLCDYAEQIEDLRHEMLFNDEFNPNGVVELKFCQALAHMELARLFLKEALLLARGAANES